MIQVREFESTVATKLTVDCQSSPSQFAPHACEMPAILAITNETAEMQPDAIEATQLGTYSGVAGGLEIVMNCHILFLLFLCYENERSSLRSVGLKPRV